MAVCIPDNKPPYPDISSTDGSSIDLSNSTNFRSGDLSVNELEIYLTNCLSIEDTEISTAGFNESPGKSNKIGVVREDNCENLGNRKSSNLTSDKCFNNCVAIPALSIPKSARNGLSSEENMQEDDKASDVNNCAMSADRCDSRHVLQPTPLKLVSAMKGSRDKQGIVPEKLTVTWAPDVYDPTPTAVSHVPSSKNQYHRINGKKYRKNKQKGGGKSSQSRRGKDKKQAQRNSGGLTKSKPLHGDALVVDFSEPYVGDFNVASPDPFCGSSFLKKSVKNLHFPVTEAK